MSAQSMSASLYRLYLSLVQRHAVTTGAYARLARRGLLAALATAGSAREADTLATLWVPLRGADGELLSTESLRDVVAAALMWKPGHAFVQPGSLLRHELAPDHIGIEFPGMGASAISALVECWRRPCGEGALVFEKETDPAVLARLMLIGGRSLIALRVSASADLLHAPSPRPPRSRGSYQWTR